MKKLLSLLLALVMSLSVGTSVGAAKVGSVIGTAYNTDIVAYVNNYAISSYAVNGQSAIVAEDLKNFGFDVAWDETTRSLGITRSTMVNAIEIPVNKVGASGSKFANILATDIKVFAGDKQLTSYAINGYTLIPFEELNIFGECDWVESQRAVKLWLDGLHIRDNMQEVGQYVAPAPVVTKAVSQSSGGTSYSGSTTRGNTVYVASSGNGKRYHYKSSCISNSRSMSLSSAISAGYTPCKKCAQ